MPKSKKNIVDLRNKMFTVTFKIPSTLVDMINRISTYHFASRSEFIRYAIIYCIDNECWDRKKKFRKNSSTS